MAEADDWNMQPPGKLGPLRLGMSRAEAAAHDAIFGAPERVDDRSNYAAEAEAALGDFAEFFSAEDTRQAVAALRKAGGEDADLVIEYRRQNSPILEFRLGRLETIRTDSRCSQLHLNGFLIQGRSPQEVIGRLSELDPQPIVLGNSLIFPSIAVELVDYVENREGQPLRLIEPQDIHYLRFLNLVSHEMIDRVASSYGPVAVDALKI